MSISELHSTGGTPFMIPLDLLFLVNVGLTFSVIIRMVQKMSVAPYIIETIRWIANLAAAFGAFSTLVGLFFAFGALEEIKEGLAFYIIAGGLKVGLITALYGLTVYMVSMVAYIIVKVVQKDQPAH